MSPPTGDFARTRIIVFGESPNARYRAGRTIRTLTPHFAHITDATILPPRHVAQAIDADQSPVWLIRAGCIPLNLAHWFLPPPSPSGRPLCAFGLRGNFAHAPRANELLRESLGHTLFRDQRDAAEWQRLQAESGGDFCTIPNLIEKLPLVVSVLLDAPFKSGIAERVESMRSVDAAIRAWLPISSARCVRLPHLDVIDDPALRVAQVVTSLQRGGAERIALELTRELPRCGIRPLLFTLGTPTRAAFRAPEDLVEFPPGRNRAEHVRNFAAQAIAQGCDVVHAHLLSADDMALIAEFRLPIVATIHNVKQGWPAGFQPLSPQERAVAQPYCAQGEENAPRFPVTLLAACSKAVERDLIEANFGPPIRTVWNGIDTVEFRPTPQNREAARILRQQLELSDTDFVVISLANPRPQKRLDRIPAVLVALQSEFKTRGIDLEIRWIIAGEAARSSDDAMRCEAALKSEVQRLNLSPNIRVVGAAENVAALLNASDALLSVSAWEGLSLAHLEALAAGIPVIATDAGGTHEIAPENPALILVPLDASPEEIAAKLGQIVLSAREARQDCLPQQPHSKRSSFTLHTMAARYATFYPIAVQASSMPSDQNTLQAGSPHHKVGIWLIANNFTTGGAQSSARRLLLGFKAQGIPVRAAVLQERDDHPTPGLSALREAGVPVFIPELRSADPLDAVTQIIEQIDADTPRAILFWNVIAEHKILLADAIWNISIIDVSPGEMFFDSLDKYFAAPRPGLPYRTAEDYGKRLAGVVVKYNGERQRAEESLKAQTHVVPNGIDLGAAASAPLNSPGQTSGRSPQSPANQIPRHPNNQTEKFGGEDSAAPRIIIGTSARLSPQKKLEDLIEALRLAAPHLPPHVLKIAGRPESGAEDYAEKLKQQSSGLNVEWIGEFQNPGTFLGSLDIFAMISEPAGCPNASLEAMAAGLPVIATDYGGASEQVLDNITGRLVPRADPQSFANALIDLAHNPAKRAAYGIAGRQRIQEHFNVERMVEDYRRICGV